LAAASVPGASGRFLLLFDGQTLSNVKQFVMFNN
jgi:hypothetical protein